MAEQDNLELPEDFSKVGEQLGTALLKVAIEHLDGKKVGVFIADVIGQIIGGLAIAGAPIGIGLAKGIANAEDLVAPALADIAATAVGDMFGTDVPASVFATRRDRAGRTSAAAALGDGFMKTLEGQGGPLEPSDEAAKRYLGTVLNMALEGWWQGWFFEFMSSLIPQFDIGKIESFAELDDTVAQALGLGRLSRRVISPLLDATVVAPLRWKINKQYSPELLSASAAIEAHLSGQYTSAQLVEELSRQGFSLERINVLVNNARKRLSFADLVEQFERGVIAEGDLVSRAGELGYDDATANELLALSTARRRARLQDPIVDTAVAEYIAGGISEVALRRHVEAAAPTYTDAQVMIDAAKVRRGLRSRQLSSSDERRLALKQIRSVVDFRRALERENLEPDAIAALELELRMEIDDRKVLAEHKAEQEAARAAEKAKAAEEKAAREAALAARRALPTLTEYRRAYVRGHIDRQVFVDAVVREKVAITPADLELLLADADEARGDFLEQEARAEAAKATAPPSVLSIATLEAAVLGGVLTVTDFDATLAQRAVDDADRRILVALLEGKIEDRAEGQRRRDEAAAALEVKRISLPDFERAVRIGLRTRAQYAALLDEVDTPAIARALILDLLDAQLAADAAAHAAREQRDPVAKAAGLSLAQRRRAVIGGALPRAAYEAALVEAGWPVDDRLVDLALVDAETEEAARARARRNQVDAETADSPLTLGQVERAVRLGLLPPSAMRDYLRVRRYTDADVEMLVGLAVAGVPDVRAAQQADPRATVTLAEKGISHVDLKRAVRRGLFTLDGYAETLAAQGFGADDVALLRLLLAEETAIGVEALRRKIVAALAKVADAPTLDEIEALFASGDLDVAGVRDMLAVFGVDRDAAIVYARLLLSFGPEGS